jgi:AraC family transcriptional regulator, regulatory protein of adaptative response / methylated-DNA-[protein]-cysteine methyltransferase
MHFPSFQHMNNTATPLIDEAGDDYKIIQRAVEFMSHHWREHPSTEIIAHNSGVSSTELHHIFARFAGITPKAFMQAITLDQARILLKSNSVMDTSYELGLSGSSRLHDLFVTHEAMSPGEYRKGGQGLNIHYSWHASLFGHALIMITARGLCGLAFANEGQEQFIFEDMTRRWPKANFVHDTLVTAPFAARIFNTKEWCAKQPLRVVLIGTDFQLRVWQTLLDIPLAKASTYSDIATKIGSPKASRAVGAAVGRNPISFVVPCHRVIGKSGALTGYHWGLTRKRAMLGWEAGQVGTIF